MNKMRTMILSFVLQMVCCMLYAQPSSISPKEYQAMLGKGFDVDWWGRKEKSKIGEYSAIAVGEFAKKGIKNVRIRLHHYDFTSDDFKRLDEQISTCLQSGIVPIVAFSAKPYKENPTKREHKRVVTWWKNMAEHCKSLSPMVSFDLVIEPSDLLKKDVSELNLLYEDCVSVIRKTNPTRIIFIAPNKLSNPEGLKYLKLPTESNGFLMAEWHFYAAGPSKTNENKLWTTGTDKEKNILLKQIKMATDWQSKTGVLTWVGAWMPGNYNKGDDYRLTEQMAFSSFMSKELSKLGIPFSINADKHFYDYRKEKWIEEKLPLLDTIFGDKLNGAF